MRIPVKLDSECAQQPATDVALDVSQLLRIERRNFVKAHRQLRPRAGLKYPVEHHAVKMHMRIEQRPNLSCHTDTLC